MRWCFSFAEDPGGRSVQQDRIALVPLAGDHRQLLVLADGMGGHSDGGIAAQRVIDTARSYASRPWSEDPGGFLQSLCFDAHLQIAQLSLREHPPGAIESPPGSTCVLLLVEGPEAYWAHVGDSRLNYLRRGQVIRQTQDHALRELRTAHGAVQRSVLYMCLGGSKTPQPSLDFLSVEAGDLVVLSSDGFWEQVSAEELAAYVQEHGLSRTTATELVGIASRRGGKRADNISLLMAQWGKPVPVSRRLVLRRKLLRGATK
jgi:serine/threonine protein phosphatase PrpC